MSISYTRDLFMTRTGLHSGSEKYRFHQAEEPGSPDLRDLCFCMCIHKREVLVEAHQTCWLQRLLFFHIVIPNVRLQFTFSLPIYDELYIKLNNVKGQSFAR